MKAELRLRNGNRLVKANELTEFLYRRALRTEAVNWIASIAVADSNPTVQHLFWWELQYCPDYLVNAYPQTCGQESSPYPRAKTASVLTYHRGLPIDQDPARDQS
jgi:hypothetical protein